MTIALGMTMPIADRARLRLLLVCLCGHRLRRRGRESPAHENGRDFGISAADLRRRRLLRLIAQQSGDWSVRMRCRTCQASA